MQRMKQIIVILLLSIGVFSCSSLPKYESKILSDNNKDDTFRYYDEEGKIRYDVYNDDDNIYIRIATSDYSAQTKILKSGFNIWVDQKGKKNKDAGIVYPQKQDVSKKSSRKKDTSLTQEKSNNQDKQKMLLERLHKQYEKSEKIMSIIGLGDVVDIEDINLEFEQYDITASINFDEYGELQYEAIIPIKYIFTDKKDDNGVYSVGIVSGKIDIGNSMRTQRDGKGKGGGRGMGGGRPGGRKPSVGKSQMSGLSTPIDIWFSVKINKS